MPPENVIIQWENMVIKKHTANLIYISTAGPQCKK